MVSLSPAAFDAFLTRDVDSAVAMLNLVQFEPDGGVPAREHNFA